jgi:siroheme synthase
MRRAEKGKVYLVGSGPRDPELMTVRAVRLLETADVVFHDDLVPDEVLGLVHRSVPTQTYSRPSCSIWETSGPTSSLTTQTQNGVDIPRTLNNANGVVFPAGTGPKVQTQLEMFYSGGYST